MHYSRWTLRSRLIGLTVLLVAATSLLVGGVVTLVVSNTLTGQFDTSLQNSARNPNAGAAAQGNAPFIVDADESVFAVYAFSNSGSVVQEGYHYTPTSSSTQLKQTALSSTQYKALRAAVDTTRPDGKSADGVSSTITVVDLPDLGAYRVAVTWQSSSGQAFYVGRPLSLLNAQLARYLLPILVVVILAIVLAGLLAALIIGQALRPLRRVAAVASNVASLPLERGDVEVPERVPEEDTNPHTEVGQVGAALNNLLDSMESALAVRQASEEKVRNFVADASHELRTPLASIRGYAELTRRFGGDLDEHVQHNIGRIESEAKRMTSLVEDLLLLARLDAERQVDAREVDLSRIVVDAVSDAHAAGPDHEWDLNLPEEPVTVRGDDAKLRQVFANLLANARVHTPAGTRVVVELSQPRDGHVLAQVRDDGPGIPEKLRPQLFGRFVRGDSSRARTTGSTGLGLAIVSAVVEAHHGTVSVASEPGATVFTVQLPVDQPAVAKAPQPA